MNKSQDNQLQLTYGFQITEPKIPFVTVHHQELLFRLDKYMDEAEVFKIQWNVSEFDYQKNVSLLVDQKFFTILRIVGHSPVSYRSNISGQSINESFVTIDCPQNFLSTYSWQCGDGNSINATLVCDDKADCPKGQDEDPLLCKGIETWYMRMVRNTSLTLYFCGFFVIGSKQLSRIWTKKKNSAIKERQNHQGRNDDEYKKAFKSVRLICKRLKDKASDLRISEPSSFELDTFKNLVKEFHNNGPIHFAKLSAIILDISKEDAYYEICCLLIDMMNLLAHQTLHQDKKSANLFLHKSLSTNYETADRFLSTRERNDYFSVCFRSIRIKIIAIIGRSVYNKVVHYGSITLCILTAVKFVTMFHVDMILDVSFTAVLSHIHENFLQTSAKMKLIKNMDIKNVVYYYPILSFGSVFVIYIFLGFQQKQKTYENCSTAELVLDRILLLFPIHYLCFRMARNIIKQINTTSTFKEVLKNAMEEDDETSDQIEKYFEIKGALQNNFEEMLELHKLFFGVVLIEIGMEGIPQVEVVLSLLMALVTSDYGRLKYIFDGLLKSLFGIGGTTLYGMLIVLTLNKYLGQIARTAGKSIYPMGLGFKATVICVIAHSILLWSKVAILAVLLSTSPYLYPLVALLEMILVFSACKMLNSTCNVIDQLLPCLFSIANWVDTNEDKETSKSLRKPRIWTITMLHNLNLIIIYLPFYIVLNYVPTLSIYASKHSNTLHLTVLLVYLFCGVVYVLLMLFQEKFAKRWHILSKMISETVTIEITDASKANVETDQESEDEKLMKEGEP